MARRCSRRNVPHDEVDEDEEDAEIPVLARRRKSTRHITVSTDEEEEEEEEEGRRRSVRVRRQAVKEASDSDSEEATHTEEDEKSEEDYVEKRRSERVYKQTKKTANDFDSDDLLTSSEDEDESGEEEDGEKLRIEKLLARKKTSATWDKEQDEFLIKWKGLSHIHCSWKTRSEILDTKLFPGGKTRLNRFEQGMDSDEESDSESSDKKHEVSDLENGRYFPEDFCVVDRIVAHRPSSGRRVARKEWPKLEFLVKWCLLGYECATWENWGTLERLDIEQTSPYIEQYFRFVEPRETQVSSRGGSSNRSRQKGRVKVASSSRARGHNKSVAVDFANLNFPAECSLRDYQIEGVKWLSFNWMQNRNSILADEMGLGKTVQVAAFTAHLFRNNGVPGPFLVVAPLSTLQHWRREYETWVPYLNSVVYHGGTQARETIRQYEFRFDKKFATKRYKFDVLITSYEMCIADAGRLKHISWDAMFVDESHRLKNISSRLFQELVRFRRSHCVFLTGTPIQNSLEELWTLLHFLDKDTFHSGSEFLEDFGDLKDKKDVDELHSVLKPYFLRRMKGDVEKDLPSRQEIVIDVEMTVLQKKLYKAVYERNTKFLVQKTTMPSLMNVGMQLRKCCNHPYLLRGVEDAQLAEDASDEEKMDLLINSSGKFVLLDKLLPKLAREGHRVLIFSQMVRMLDIIEDYLHYRRILYERIDGGIRGAARQKAIDNFTNNPLVFVFMLATRAGGVGINLTAADTVIIFDSDWNPQNDLQAQARCHRIGQTQEVKVYRLVTKNTYEGVMFERASMKLGLDLAVLHPMTRQLQSGGSDRLNKDDIEGLLKYGAYHFVDDSSDAKSRQFCDQDIDEILANASRTIEQSSTSATGSTFAKATFVISAPGGLQLDINDPDFWSKVGLSYEEENEMLQLGPRKRRRVLRFGSYSGMQDGRGQVSRDEHDDDWSGPDSNGDNGHSSTSGDGGSGSDADASMQLQHAGGKRHRTETSTVKDWKWKLADRDRFFAALLMFGFGRWQAIAQYEAAHGRGGGAFSQRSTDEMRLYALGLVHKCVEAANADNNTESALRWSRKQAPLFLSSSLLRRELSTCLKLCNKYWSGADSCVGTAASGQTASIAATSVAAPSGGTLQASTIQSIAAGLKLVPLDGSLCNARFDISLRRKARTSLSALERMYTLQASCDKLCPGVEPDWDVVAAEACERLTAHRPTSWWTQVHDSALLEGTWFCGQGNYRLLDQRQSSPLCGRIFPPVAGEPSHYPSLKSLTFRVRALITNLARRRLSVPVSQSKCLPTSSASNSVVLNASGDRSSTSQQHQYHQFHQLLLQQQALELQQQQQAAYEQLLQQQQQQQYYMNFQPQVPFRGQQLTAYEQHQQQQMNQPATFMPHQQLASAAQFHPQAQKQKQQQQEQQQQHQQHQQHQLLTSALETVQLQQQQEQQQQEQQPEVRQLSLSQFSEEYRLLLSMCEELLNLYPSQLLPVLQKANYLMAQFALKEGEANQLGKRFSDLKDCYATLAENARELSTLFRRVRRRVNKCCRIRQLVSAWAASHGVSDVSSAQLPPELAEKQSAEKDLLMRTSDCLGSVASLTLRNGLILQRIELSGHTS